MKNEKLVGVGFEQYDQKEQNFLNNQFINCQLSKLKDQKEDIENEIKKLQSELR